jgi:uncharacterized damage-inducible protein DinB
MQTSQDLPANYPVSMATILQQIEFEHWANAQSFKAVDAAGAPIPEAISILAHCVAISNVWAARAEGRTESLEAWPQIGSADLKTELERLRERWVRLAGSHSPEDEIFYTSSNGQKYSNRFDEVLQEVLLHGAHHRGQIALTLRLKGFAPPPSTDFIPALRNAAYLR